mgnify:FL=1|tara:strand:+ start:14883 stop:15476 length:594 start_codon:yes stop_codon:yes gene_type:complete
MPFWSQSFKEDVNLKDPKRRFRFTVSITGIASQNGGPLLWYSKSVDKPMFTLNHTEHKYLNHTYYYPGNVTWNEISMKLVDPGGDPDVAATLAAMAQASGYAIPSTPDDLTSVSKAKATAALGTITITQIDADGKPVEQWTLWNAMISEIDFGGTLEYGQEELVELSLKVRYDWARIETPNSQSSAVALGGNSFFNV